MKISTLAIGISLSAMVGVFAPPTARADDIDIFIGENTSAAAPNVIFLLDNTSNWSRQANQWGTNYFDGSKQSQGQAELDAIVQVIAQINAKGKKVNFGVAMLTDNTTPYGGFIRFGARDMSVAANFQAFYNIMGYNTPPPGVSVAPPSYSIYAKVQNPAQKISDAHKREGEALYEIYKYFNGLRAYAGNSTEQPLADWPSATDQATPAGQGLTAGFALASNGKDYNSSVTACSKQYIVYIANNSKGNSYFNDDLSYESATQPDLSGKSYSPDTSTPEWTRFLSQNSITTFFLDVTNLDAPNLVNADYSESLQEAAKQAGSLQNNYYNVHSKTDVEAAINTIVTSIQTVNDAFAATSLPASATNRSVDQNEVFIGVFRPDGGAKPRWYGNLKRYAFILTSGGTPDLGDAAGVSAVDPTSGFLRECAVSFWTTDTSAYIPSSATPTSTNPAYWDFAADRALAANGCLATDPNNPASIAKFAPPAGITWSQYSDLSDGPKVEKGGAAEVLRQGNANASTPDWQVHRTVLTQSLSASAGSTPSAFTSTTISSDQKLGNFILGWDSNDENVNNYTSPDDSASTKLGTETRTSIHGDVIHSTPLPVTYNSTADGVVIYYGSNDGMYHAVNGNNGKEIWSFLAPEFYSRMNRLYTNAPLIRYPDSSTGYPSIPDPADTNPPTFKDYFFDGSTGIYQSVDNRKTWIYPSMRRGGRMIYAFDVSGTSYDSTKHTSTPPPTPTYLWKAGCPNLGDDTGCTNTGITDIGMTFSTPIVGGIKKLSTDTSATQVVIFGGGYSSTPYSVTVGSNTITYNSCEDNNLTPATPMDCPNRKGSVVYIFDAHDGPGSSTLTTSGLPMKMLLPSTHGTPGSVVGDIALLDANNDGFIDYAYFSDTNGFVYRISFVDSATSLTPQTPSNWTITQVAGTKTHGRKFEFAPTLFFNHNVVYVGLGSGDREHPLYTQYPVSGSVQNNFYLFIDDPATTNYQDLDSSTTMQNATGATCDTAPVLPGGTIKGWVLPLSNGTGEQTVTPAVIVSGQVSWGTNRALPPSTNSCTNKLGEARGYLVDLVNGSGSLSGTGICTTAGTTPVTSTTYNGGGLPPPPEVGIVAVPNGQGGTTYVGTCIGCPGGGSTIEPVNPFTSNLETRRRVYWFTPNYQ